MATMQQAERGHESGREPMTAGATPVNDRLLRALRRAPVDRPPVWMMRQAGRYLPEYRAVRAKSDFLTMCRTPELAAEVTMQPVDLIGVDAAIVFSDILVVPEAMGMELHMDEGKGPSFPSPIRSAADVARLADPDPEQSIRYTLDALRLVRRELNGRVPLIGFAGAPWTLAAYMIEGSGTKSFAHAKKFLMTQPRLAHELLSRVADIVGRHLAAQVAAGAQVVQLFESWGGALAPEEFRAFALPYLAHAAATARAAGAPLVVFVPACPVPLDEVAEATGAEVLGIDWHTAPEAARRLADRRGVAIQGNLDPCCLYAPPATVRMRTRAMLAAMDGPGYIANLGHGILPDVPVEGARAFIDAVRAWRSGDRESPR